ncbi:MAG: hypothetical protein WBP13_09360 [Methylophilaceae bacterium]
MTLPLILQLKAISSLEDENQLKQLQSILDAIKPEECNSYIFTALFDIFERFPESDGYGLCWSILHLLEACKGYEPFLIASVLRKPVEFNVLMINRQINGGIKDIDGQNLFELLQSVASNDKATSDAKDWANHFINFQLKGGINA